MMPGAPPVDLRPFVSDSQKLELDLIPAHCQRLGAWLLISRDDKEGKWIKRTQKCCGCIALNLPCIESATNVRDAHDAQTTKCEGCSISHLDCVTGPTMVETTDIADRAGSSSAGKRKREPDSTTATAIKAEVLEDRRDDRQSSRAKVPKVGTEPRKPVAEERITLNQSARLPDYDYREMLDILIEAQQRSPVDVSAEFEEKMIAFRSIGRKSDFTVSVRKPTETSAWMIVVVDHKKRIAQAFFSAAGRRRGNEVDRRVVEDGLDRAYKLCYQQVTVEAVDCPYLCSTHGSFYPTAVAVALIRSLPGFPSHEVRINHQEAVEDLQNLLRKRSDPLPPVRYGAKSKVVARFHREGRRVEWVSA